MRTNRSLYGDPIKEALMHEQPWLKSEELPEFLPFYVGEELLDQIHNNTNHLIVGRRGTGKTHLLGAFNEWVKKNSTDEISIMMSIMDVTQTPPMAYVETPPFTEKRTAREIFHQFMHLFFKRFLESVDDYMKTKLLNRFSRKESDQIIQAVNNQLTQLLEAIELGREFPVKSTARSKSASKNGVARNKEGGFRLGIDRLTPKISGELGMKKTSSDSDTSEYILEVESLLTMDLGDVRDLIHEIVKLLKLKTYYVLVDEWMELDKNTPSNIQPIFAQLLKRVFFNQKLISVKIASVWHQTTLYDKNDLDKSQGMQLGHDIQIGADLDSEFFNTEEEVFTFSKEMLFKRLRYACPKLAELQRAEGFADDIFITELFDSQANFKAFIAASHGLPRDLWKLFQKCSLRIKRNFKDNCIDHILVAAVAKDIYRLEKRKSIDPSSAAQMLLGRINKYIESTGHRLFLVENARAMRCPPLRKLTDEELIHQLPSSGTHRTIRDNYKAFLIDYGNFADWIETRRRDITELLAESVVARYPASFEGEYQDYVIDISEVLDDKIDCEECRYAFPKTHPVYLKASICPRCGADIAVKPATA